MTYEVYRYIFIGGAILSVIMLIISVILFIILKIPNVIGDLTGANAKKAIENIRNQNESTGDKLYKSSEVNRSRGKLTDRISPSGNLIRNPSTGLHGAMKTEKISTQRLNPENTGKETTVLGSNGTTVLNAGNETAVLGGENQTTVLNNVNETTVLSGVAISGGFGGISTADGWNPIRVTPMPQQEMSEVAGFEITYEITFIHTQEIIV